MAEATVEKACTECNAPVIVPAVIVNGRTLNVGVVCETCAAADKASSPVRIVSDHEETIRTNLDYLGINVPAHGRYPLSHILGFMPADVGVQARAFVDEVQKAGKWDPVRGLIIEGPTGVGKSWVAIGIARELLERRVLTRTEIRYDRSRSVWGIIRSAYGGGDAAAELSARMAARLWLLDDFGAEHATDDTAANLTDILSARELRPTILTANIPREAQGGRYNPEFWDRIRSRLGDRNFRVIQVHGRDHRELAS